jgi:hypothetical protein
LIIEFSLAGADKAPVLTFKGVTMTVEDLINKLLSLNQPFAEVAVFHFGIVTDVEPADSNNAEVIIRTDSEDDY